MVMTFHCVIFIGSPKSVRMPTLPEPQCLPFRFLALLKLLQYRNPLL